MFFAVTAEVGQRGEVHPLRYLGEGVAGIVQVLLEDGDGVPVDVGHDGAAGEALYRGGEILFRNVELPGIPSHGALRAGIPFGEEHFGLGMGERNDRIAIQADTSAYGVIVGGELVLQELVIGRKELPGRAGRKGKIAHALRMGQDQQVALLEVETAVVVHKGAFPCGTKHVQATILKIRKADVCYIFRKEEIHKANIASFYAKSENSGEKCKTTVCAILPTFALQKETDMKKQVTVLVGAGSIGQAIIRRVSAGKHVVLADYSLEHAERAAEILENAGFECSTIKCDLGSKEDILKLVEFATSKGEVTNVVNAAGVSPSQAPVAEILRVDLYGTSVLLEEFGKVIAEGGSGVIISSQSGHRLPALPQEQNGALATTPVDELLQLPFLKEINDTLKAYQYSKRCNVLRVMYEATRWGRRGATINSISPGIIITPLANDELHGQLLVWRFAIS